MATSSGILQSYLLEAISRGEGLDPKKLLAHKRTGGDFLTPLNYYLGILADTDPVRISYMSFEQKAQLEHDLTIAAMLLEAQKLYESQHQKTENANTYDNKIIKCKVLLSYIGLPRIQALENTYGTDGNPVKYCGIHLADEFVKQMVKMTESKSETTGTTKTLRKFLDSLNSKRLYWVWGSSFIKTMLELVPADFYNTAQAVEVIKTPDTATGTLSWALYYFRFSMNLFLLLKHTMAGPWMSKEERQTPWYERFQTQWAQRKFTLLNDSIWGTANLLCFFWLNGKDMLGALGDLLTVGLLIFDVCIALWDFAEQETQYYARIEQFDKDILALNQEDSLLRIDHHNADDNEKRKIMSKIHSIQRQLNALVRERALCKREWAFQNAILSHNIVYAVSLTIAFVVLTTPFMPFSAGVTALLGPVGAILCFALTLISNSIKGGISIYKEQETLKEVENSFGAQVKRLINEKDLSDDAKKLLYLEIKKLDATTEYQSQMIAWQTATLIRSILIESLVPALVFSAFVFLSVGTGLGVLGAALGLAMGTQYLIEALLKPDEKMKELPEQFDEEEYDKFCKSLEESGDDVKAQHTFFKQKRDKSAKALPKASKDVSADESSKPDGCEAIM